MKEGEKMNTDEMILVFKNDLKFQEEILLDMLLAMKTDLEHMIHSRVINKDFTLNYFYDYKKSARDYYLF